MKSTTLLTLSVIATATLLLSGCPKTKRRTLVPEVPTTGDATARTRFQEARADFERDRVRNAAEFEAIAQAYPEDPIASYALLYAGISSVDAGDYQAALEPLQALTDNDDTDPGLRTRGRLFLGMAHAHLGAYDRALEALRAGEPAIQTEDERDRYTASMAEAVGHSQRPLDALAHYDRWYQRATAPEKAYITTRLQAIAQAADPADAERRYRDIRDARSPSATVLGLRVAAALREQGQIDSAQRIELAIEPMRAVMNLAVGYTGATTGSDANRVAAVLPLTGRRARVGEPAMRGLALAAGTFASARGGDIVPFQLSMHDTMSTDNGARGAFDDSEAEGAIAVIGPIDGKSVDSVAAMATRSGLTMISLNVRSGRRARENSRFVFHMLHSAEDRAESLARHAVGKGIRRVAVLRPDNGYGRAVSRAFEDELRRLGGQVTSQAVYDTNTTSFGKVIGELGSGYQAVFIPDQASRLELITPALAAADLRVRPLDTLNATRGAAKTRGNRSRQPGRAIGLLSTAELVTPDYLRTSGRYSEGAVFAPGFFPDRSDPMIRDFVERFEIAYSQAPTALDAYAYDAARMVRRAVQDQGVQRRDQLADMLGRMHLIGLTGEIAFGDKHRRSDDGLLFRVARDGGEYAIVAMR